MSTHRRGYPVIFFAIGIRVCLTIFDDKKICLTVFFPGFFSDRIFYGQKSNPDSVQNNTVCTINVTGHKTAHFMAQIWFLNVRKERNGESHLPPNRLSA